VRRFLQPTARSAFAISSVPCALPLSGEVVERHLREALVAQDAGVVDQDVNRLVDHGLHRRRVGHRRTTGHRLAAGDADFLDHRERGGRRAAIAVERAAQVVHHHPGATRRQRQRMQTPQPATSTGDHGHAAIESHRHWFHFP
jgi:hypothetical protein